MSVDISAGAPLADLSSGDPFRQSFVLVLADGTPFNLTVTDLQVFSVYNVRTSINYGTQLGATLMLLIVMILLTKPEKRRAPVFLINISALACNFIRTLLQCLYFTSGFNVPYAFFSGDFSRVPASDYATSVAANVLTLLVLILVEASLVLQIHVVCATMQSLYRRGVTAICALVALVAIGFRCALVVENAKAILQALNFAPWEWLASATNIATTVSICIFSAIFLAKLTLAMWERRKLGLRQYGPMRIIFIMGCQTMTVPAIFAILQYFSNVPELATNVPTLVTIFLPLSSMWAATSIQGQKKKPIRPQSQHKLVDSRSSGSAGPRAEAIESKGLGSPSSISALDMEGSHISTSGFSGKDDLEAQQPSA